MEWWEGGEGSLVTLYLNRVYVAVLVARLSNGVQVPYRVQGRSKGRDDKICGSFEFLYKSRVIAGVILT